MVGRKAFMNVHQKYGIEKNHPLANSYVISIRISKLYNMLSLLDFLTCSHLIMKSCENMEHLESRFPRK